MFIIGVAYRSGRFDRPTIDRRKPIGNAYDPQQSKKNPLAGILLVVWLLVAVFSFL
jgi:hypothetical protein